jgi:sialate O-acetylesterase
MRKIIIIAIILLYLNPAYSFSKIKVAGIFSDNMVLQQLSSVPIWGNGDRNDKIVLMPSWNNKRYEAKVNDRGFWKLQIPTPRAGGPYTVDIESTNHIIIKNVFIGEVWLASGQSNMSMPLTGYKNQPVDGSTEAILDSKGKNIHFINIPALASYKPQDDISDAKWEVASPATAGTCSAVAWFFADLLHRQLDIPIGIINASFSGSNVEAWMSEKACHEINGIEVPPLKNEVSADIANVATLQYNAMIHPLEGYAIKGFLWYQGESNIFNVPRYAPSVAAMIKYWRQSWNMGTLPFYYVQIAPYNYKEWNFFTPQWPEISAYQREAQMNIQKLIPNSGMVVTMDLGEKNRIHYPRKKEVGQRLAMLALNRNYGMDGFESESPEYEKMEVKGDTAILHFSKQFMGITSNGKTMQLFEISGDNKVFLPATAYVDESNGTVIVYNRLVGKPVAVRYAFKNYCRAELFGTGGLPVSSFRTDKW